MARRLAISVVALLLLPTGAQAAVFDVNSTADAPDADGLDGICATAGTAPVCTIRAAVMQASDLAGDDVINLPAGDYPVSGAPGDDQGNVGDLDLRPTGAGGPQAFTLAGAGARVTRIIGAGTDRVIDIPNGSQTATISGVTITGGAGVPNGGGIRANGTINLVDVTILGNRADDPTTANNQGGGIFFDSAMSMTGVTISGNVATGTGNPQGGGVFDQGEINQGTMTNVTITGNDVTGNGPGFPQGGGMFYNAENLSTTLRNVTIAGNTLNGTAQGAGLFVNAEITLANTIVSGNRAGTTVSNCFANDIVHSLGSNLEEGTDCGFATAGDLQSANPLLGPLQDNGGPTNTLALLAGSPAINAGLASQCPTTDQRGVARPQGPACDIGAFEFVAAASQPPPPPTELPPPVLGKRVNVRVVSGRVLIAVRGGGSRSARASQKGLKFVPLTEERQIPVGSFLDTKRGTVALTSATGSGAKTQTGKFSAGIFQVLQSRKKRLKGLTTATLKGSSFKRCRTRRGKRATASKLSHRTIRRLKANAKGRFRTGGNYSANTVRGTIWITADRCDGTLTTVKRGKVAVRDFRRKKTILVKAGKSYLAKAPGA